VKGARAAIRLAQRLNGAIDHMESSTLLRGLDVLRETGMMVTTPSEARLRADLFLLVGPAPGAAGAELAALVSNSRLGPQSEEQRRLVWLCPGRRSAIPIGTRDIEIVGRDAADLPALLAALRAHINGRRSGRAPVQQKTVGELAASLKAARFGVAIWSAAQLDAPTIGMLCGLVDDLNIATRFSTIPLPPADNAMGVLEACGWLTGLPMRTAFLHGDACHDPWRFDAARLVESGEADCVLWVSAYRPIPPTWKRAVDTVALVHGATAFRRAPRVSIAVGQPGVDHDSVEHLFSTGTLAVKRAIRRSEAPAVADVIAEIAALLPSAEAHHADLH
jgi:formylmethanofuran dehydrogenase subunit B